jgi:predicted PurR-regulated permease PerM
VGIVALISIIILPLSLIATPFTQQTQSFVKSLPSIFQSLDGFLNEQFSHYGFSVNNLSLSSFFEAITKSVQSIVSGTFTAVGYGVDALVKVVLTFFIAGFIAVAPEEYKQALRDFFPTPTRRFLRCFGYDLKNHLQHWIVGLFLAMLFVGSLSTLGCWIIGLKYFVVFGVLAGTLEIIPYFGPTLAAILPTLFALTQEPSKAIWVVVIFMTIQFIENYFFLPFLWKKQVNIPPAISIFVIILFGQLLGFLGILLAIPIFLFTRTLATHLYLFQSNASSFANSVKTAFTKKDSADDACK